jgi:peptidoglycan L-alanyl-D-glutamate endopeptidase CwlK
MKKLPIDYDSRDLNDLIPSFRTQIDKLIINCAKKKIKIVPYSTVRGPLIQARNYCVGRTNLQLNAILEHYKQLGCKNMEKVLTLAVNELPKRRKSAEKIVTRALPGQSWHMWGEAVDFYIEDPKTKKPNWTTPKYSILQKEAEALKLTSGGSFKTLVEPVHVQFSSLPAPNHSYFNLDKFLGERFSF